MRRRSMALTACLACAISLGGVSMADRVVLDNVDRYRVMDPNYEAARIALSHRGEQYSPEYIQGISGYAFRVAGPCPCAPTCSGMMDTPALLKLLGYDVRIGSVQGEGDARRQSWLPLVERIKGEIRAGRPVLVWNAFINYEWDLVCGFDDEKGEWIGRGSYVGNQDLASAPQMRPLEGSDVTDNLALFVGSKTGALDALAAELAALEEAIHHAHSPEDPFLAEAGERPLPWRFREGLACYEAWIRSFRIDPQKVPGAGDRYPLGVYRSTHRAAAAFLREIAPKYPEAAPQFERAAGLFTADADALDKCYDTLCGGWDSWKEPDPTKAARMADLLTQAHRSCKSGIKEIEVALDAIDHDRVVRAHHPAIVQRQGEKVWIDRVRSLHWGRNRDCTFCGALEAAMAVTAHPYTYADLMGLSGLAFRVRWANADTKTKWCPSSAVGEMPDEIHALSKLTGWELQDEYDGSPGRDNERLRRKLVAAIDASRPVVTYPAGWDMAIAYGYEDNGRTALVKDYNGGDDPSAIPIEKMGALQVYLSHHTEPPALRECLVEALRTAVRNWHRTRGDGGVHGREYWYGAAASQAWIRDLADADHYPVETKQALLGLAPWNYAALCDARRAAVSFLKDWSLVVDGEAQEALQRAAGLYEKETKILEPVLTERKAGEVHGGETMEGWFARGRLREAQALTDALQLESAAMAEIEKALAVAAP